MEPVQIDITMKQNVAEEAPKASKAISDLAFSSTKAQQDIAETIAFQKKIIKELESELAPAKAAFEKWNKASSDPAIIAQRKKLSEAYHNLNSELEGEKTALADLEKQAEKFNKKSTNMQTEIERTRSAMIQLKLAGQQNSEQYKELETKLELLKKAYRELQVEEKNLVTNTGMFEGIVQGVGALSGVLSAGAGAFGLINEDSEAFAKIQTKIQSLMAITIGLQQVANTLTATSSFRINVVTKVSHLWAAANLRVATTLGISTAAAQVLMATLTLGLSVAITGLVVMLDRIISKNKEAAASSKKYNESASESASKSIADFMALKTAYDKLGDSVKEKNKFIINSQSEFDKLGISITSINEAENLFTKNTDAFKKALLERAESAAAMDLATEKIKESLQKQLEADNTKSTGKQIVSSLGILGLFMPKVDAGAIKKTKLTDESNNLFADANKLVEKSIASSEAAKKTLSNAGIAAGDNIKKGIKSYWENEQKAAQNALELMADDQKGSKAWNEALSRFNKAKKKLETWDFSDKKKGKTEEEKAAEKLAKLTVDIQKDINAAVIAAMEEGKNKKLAELKNEYDQKIQTIKTREAEIAEIEKATGKPATKARTLLDAQKTQVDTTYNANIIRTEKEAAKLVQDVWKEVNSQFKSDLDNQLDNINKFYDDQLKVLRENITDKNEQQSSENELNIKRLQELETAKNQSSLKQIENEEQLQLQKQEILNKDVFFEADKERKILEIQKEYALKKLEILKVLQAAGVKGLDTEISSLENQIASIDNDIEKTASAKIQEITSYATAGLSIISTLAKSMDENVAKGLETLEQGIAAAGELAAGIVSGDPKAIIGGLQKMAGVVASIITANKEANKEIRKFQEAQIQLAVEYSLALIKAIKDIKSANDSIFADDIQNSLVQGMESYSAAIAKQSSLMSQLSSVTVKTGVVKTRFLGIVTGTKDVYSDLLKTYPDLITKDGELNRTLADTLLKSGNLSKEAEKLLNNILSAADAAKEAMDQVNSSLESLVGSIGDDLRNALVDAFVSGGDAAETFKGNVSQIIQDLISKMMFSAVFGEQLAALEKQMKASYSSGGDYSITDDIISFYKNYSSSIESFNKGLSEAQKELSKQGIEIFTTVREGTSAAALAQASQYSIDVLAGGVEGIRYTVSDLRNIAKEQLVIFYTFRTILTRIADNTDYLKHLADIKLSLEEMNNRGVKIKS